MIPKPGSTSPKGDRKCPAADPSPTCWPLGSRAHPRSWGDHSIPALVRLTHQVVPLSEAGRAWGCPVVQGALSAAHGELARRAGRHQEALGVKRAGGENRGPGCRQCLGEHGSTEKTSGDFRGNGGSGGAWPRLGSQSQPRDSRGTFSTPLGTSHHPEGP